MTLCKESTKWAIEFLSRHSDGDIFPPIPEISAIRTQPQGLIDALENKPLKATFPPQPCRRFIVPKEAYSYRQATQLHPQDSVILSAVVYQYGKGIEERRLPPNRVFSYRFAPDLEHGLYGSERLWNDFWSTGRAKSESYPYVLYCDIADFYNQISHHTVENQLFESGFPNQAVKWIVALLESTTANVSRGIPIGPHGAHLIAECTLIPIDNSLDDNGINFIRYADDLLIFCESKTEVRKAAYTFATVLDRQQRLMLQHHKTKIYGADAFREYCERMIEDRPISDDEEEILQIVKKYSSGNPYARITYNQIDAEDWKAFSEDSVSRIINEYLEREEVDYIRLQWFFRRLAQVGHHGALPAIIENIKSLEPCLPSVCSYISSIQDIPSNKWNKIGEELLRILKTEAALDTEFARLSILSLFSRNEHIDHFVKLAQRFSAGDTHSRREILLAATANSRADWIREHKESYGSMDPWQQMAFIYCVSILPREERRFFLNSLENSSQFIKQLKRWSKTHGT